MDTIGLRAYSAHLSCNEGFGIGRIMPPGMPEGMEPIYGCARSLDMHCTMSPIVGKDAKTLRICMAGLGYELSLCPTRVPKAPRFWHRDRSRERFTPFSCLPNTNSN
ncbi:hypothetical protein JCGZ_22115 [Jatropha curcas]|uniref:Uncharacterized protein n=1 Tax=Jatropha curcas TaxID=180498 RepID=A0A067LR81_JATCU|nr:hypothetical protein JCGZ_22115 [Jatropha curcas]